MTKPLNKITESRRLLQNPYAHLNGSGGYSALPYLDASNKHKISESRRKLQNQYAYLDEFGGFSAEFHLDALQETNAQKKVSYSLIEIEQLARNLQLKIWKDRARIWPGVTPSNPIDILDPAVALNLIGYECDLDETLGQFDSGEKPVEIAGTIDSHLKRVHISRQFAHNIRSFTAAHELGHAMLHQTGRMHRDRPLNGEVLSRDAIEFEADKFATFFLMPRKLVRTTFMRFFLTGKFLLNEATAHALGGLGAKKITTLRQLSRVLASAEQYNGIHFNSLAKQFNVTPEAMAIRLEELELLAI